MSVKRIALLCLMLPSLAWADTVSGVIIKEQREGVVALNVKTARGEVVEVFCMDIGPHCAGLIEEVPHQDAERITRRLMGKRVTVTYDVEPNNGRAFGGDKTVRVLRKIVFANGRSAARQ